MAECVLCDCIDCGEQLTNCTCRCSPEAGSEALDQKMQDMHLAEHQSPPQDEKSDDAQVKTTGDDNSDNVDEKEDGEQASSKQVQTQARRRAYPHHRGARGGLVSPPFKCNFELSKDATEVAKLSADADKLAQKPKPAIRERDRPGFFAARRYSERSDGPDQAKSERDRDRDQAQQQQPRRRFNFRRRNPNPNYALQPYYSYGYNQAPFGYVAYPPLEPYYGQSNRRQPRQGYQWVPGPPPRPTIPYDPAAFFDNLDQSNKSRRANRGQKSPNSSGGGRGVGNGQKRGKKQKKSAAVKAAEVIKKDLGISVPVQVVTAN